MCHSQSFAIMDLVELNGKSSYAYRNISSIRSEPLLTHIYLRPYYLSTYHSSDAGTGGAFGRSVNPFPFGGGGGEADSDPPLLLAPQIFFTFRHHYLDIHVCNRSDTIKYHGVRRSRVLGHRYTCISIFYIEFV